MAYRKLGRTCKHRRSMLANLTKDLIMNERIETTETRAKEVRSIVDELITLGKRGDLHARRQAAAYLYNVKDEEISKNTVQKLFDDVAPKYADVNGGYTRIYKTHNRKGDNAPMAIVTLA